MINRFANFTVEQAYAMGRVSAMIGKYPHPFHDRLDMADAWSRGRNEALADQAKTQPMEALTSR